MTFDYAKGMPYSIPIEDAVEDVLAKSMRGLQINKETLAQQAGLTVDNVQALLDGKVEPALLAAVAPVLRLGSEALLALAVHDEPAPEPPFPTGLLRTNTPYHDMTVNAYLVFDPVSRHATIFDSGADASDLIAAVSEQQLIVDHILLTHTHGDHIFDLDRLVSAVGAKAYAPEKEPVDGCDTVAPGATFECGSLRIEVRGTTGHSVGGTTFVVHGLSQPVAVVGDALFARSMGGPNISYTDCIEGGRDQILSLPENTILCPGHGPLTTVETEQRWNPFFAPFYPEKS